MLIFTHPARDAKEIDVTIGLAKSLSTFSILSSSMLIRPFIRPFLNGSIQGFHSKWWLKVFFTINSGFIQQKQGKQGQQERAKILKTKRRTYRTAILKNGLGFKCTSPQMTIVMTFNTIFPVGISMHQWSLWLHQWHHKIGLISQNWANGPKTVHLCGNSPFSSNWSDPTNYNLPFLWSQLVSSPPMALWKPFCGRTLPRGPTHNGSMPVQCLLRCGHSQLFSKRHCFNSNLPNVGPSEMAPWLGYIVAIPMASNPFAPDHSCMVSHPLNGLVMFDSHSNMTIFWVSLVLLQK